MKRQKINLKQSLIKFVKITLRIKENNREKRYGDSAKTSYKALLLMFWEIGSL